MPLPTLAELKVELNMSTTSDDGELAGKLDAAVDVVEGIVGPITTRTVTETHRNTVGESLLLRQMPVTALVDVAVRPFGSSVSSSSSVGDYELDPDSGTVRLVSGYHHHGTVTVTYSVGRPTVPAAIHQAILIIAAHLWETQRRPGLSMDSAPAGFGGADGIPDSGSMGGSGFAIPHRAQELLQSYMRQAMA